MGQKKKRFNVLHTTRESAELGVDRSLKQKAPLPRNCSELFAKRDGYSCACVITAESSAACDAARMIPRRRKANAVRA
jgi:hypothetical protein